MEHLSWLRRWRLARLVALALLIALAPLPVLAGEPGTAAGATSIRKSISTISATERLAATPSPAAQTGTTPADAGSPGFFKKPVGIAVLATLAAGVGYALYSSKHDRITSAGKK